MKKQIKRLIGLGLAGVLALSASMTSFAGEWKKNEIGYWWQEDNGKWVVSDWRQIEGKWYYFGSDGYMYADGWAEIPTQYSDAFGTYTFDSWYYFNASGAMDTSKNWVGGRFRDNGSFMPDEAIVNNNTLKFYNNLNYLESTPCTIGWLQNLAVTWSNNSIGGRDDVGTYKLDFQLPANWKEECAKPVLEAVLSNVLIEAWNGGNWAYQWQVDDNYIIHITANFNGYE